MRILYIIIAFIFFSLLSSCLRSELDYEGKRKIGVNGEAYYYVDKKTKKIHHVTKSEYAFKPDYSVSINNDTLKEGEYFNCYIGVYRDNHRILISSPTEKEIIGEKMPQSEGAYLPYVYEYKAVKPGEYYIKGLISFDSLTVPFEYKFIVFPK